MKQGIIFDMDGTLWDSTVGVAESWNEILKQEKVNRTPLTVEDFRGIMGKTMDVIAAKFFPDMPEKERMELLDKCGEYENVRAWCGVISGCGRNLCKAEGKI